MAPVNAHAVVQSLLTLGRPLVTGVNQPAVGLKENGRPQVLLAVPPVRRAGCRAAGAENALVEAVQLLAIFGALAVLEALLSQSN